MVSYAIEALVRAGITELMLVTGGTHAGEFFRLLGNGHEHGIDRLLYAYQEKPGGIAEALGLAERFVDRDRVCVMLADNVLERSFRAVGRAVRGAGARRPRSCSRASTTPEHLRHLGVPELDGDGRIVRIVEKPDEPPSEYAVTGHLLLRRDRLGRPADARAVRPRRARDHRRQQLVRRAGDDGVRRARGLLGRRGRVDRRVLRGQRLRPGERREPRRDRGASSASRSGASRTSAAG